MFQCSNVHPYHACEKLYVLCLCTISTWAISPSTTYARHFTHFILWRTCENSLEHRNIGTNGHKHLISFIIFCSNVFQCSNENLSDCKLFISQRIYKSLKSLANSFLHYFYIVLIAALSDTVVTSDVTDA
jgi:hypothetical protein